MKRFAFSLERVLAFKRQRERLAELKETKARLSRAAAQRRVDALQGELNRLAAEMAEYMTSSTAGESWAARFEQAGRVTVALQGASDLLADAVRAHEEARRERIRLAAEVEALHVLRQQQWNEYRKELQRHEQVHLDEIGMRRWTPPDRTKAH